MKDDKYKRVLNEVIKSSDVIIEVIDARDPIGTRSNSYESFINKLSDKTLILMLNKADLVPKEIVKKWIDYLSKEYPTFYSSDRYGYEKSIRFIMKLIYKTTTKRPVIVCIFGYPNVGKSSIINALKGKKVAPVSPIPGFTKGKQYIKLSSEEIYLIDTPGVIVDDTDSEVDLALKGAVNADKIQSLLEVVQKILEKVPEEEIINKYGIKFDDYEDFLEQLAKKRGKLLPGGVPDSSSMAKIVINDFQKGKIPYYQLPPG